MTKKVPLKTRSARKAGPSRPAKRADLGKPVEIAIERMAEPQRSIARVLDRAIRAAAKPVEGKVAWGNATYRYRGEDLFALGECRDRVNLYIGNGAAIKDADGVLEGTGKVMRHVKVRDVTQASAPSVRRVLRESVRLARAGSVGAWTRRGKDGGAPGAG